MCKKNYVGSIHNGLKSNKARLANKRASAKMIAQTKEGKADE